MRQDRHIARDISYCWSAQTKGGQTSTMEALTGGIGLIKRAAGYEHEVAQGNAHGL